MQSFSNYLLDKMVYRQEPKPKHKKRLAQSEETYEILSCKVIDAPVRMFPANSSQETIEELKQMQIAHTQHHNPSKLEEDYDDDFEWAYKKILKDAGYKYDKKYFAKLLDEAANVTIKLKYKYNRPRPHQIGPIIGVDVTKYGSGTAKTPSYPSGHTAQSLLVALVLADKYPDLKDSLIEASDEISLSRLVGGHHYPSDIEYGKEIGRWLHANVK
tara:strand:- start:739 stop:1383 length:645 start_codon:yes stop_codon:yes gene_type:complete